MNARHFMLMVGAETRAVFGRWSGRGALMLAGLIPLVSVGTKLLLEHRAADAEFNGIPLEQMLDLSTLGVLDWSLTARNFFMLPALLMLAAAASVAGERRDNTLRAVLWRPVPRPAVLLSKVAALMVLSVSSLLLSYGLGLGAGVAAYGLESASEPLMVGLGFLASALSDCGLILMTVLCSLFLRNVGAVVVSLTLVLVADKVLGLILTGLGALGIEGARTVGRMLVGTALGCWEGWKGEGWDPMAFGSLLGLIVACVVVSLVRFQRMDVP